MPTVANRDLSQTDIRRAFETQGEAPWTVVYDEVWDDGVTGGSYCAFANPRLRERRSVWTGGWQQRAMADRGLCSPTTRAKQSRRTSLEAPRTRTS